MVKKDLSKFKLEAHPDISKPEGPVMVCILDGFGFNTEDKWNGIHMAETPVYDGLRKVEKRFRTVRAHGTAVGLPSDADMGNSEVGHNALGSGQVVDQGARLVDIALEDGSAFSGEGFQFIKPALEEHTLHFIGLLSDGGVHSRYDQLKQFIDGATKEGAKRIRVHILTDGRDVPDGTSVKFTKQLEEDLKAVREGGCDAKIASGGGRMGVTMDRYEADWSIVEKGWKAHVLGEAPHKFPDALTAITELRKGGVDGKPVTDQWLPPFVIEEDGKPVGTIEDGDAVVLFNFRADRMVEISKAFEYEDFDAFDRVRFPKTLFAGMMQYDGDLKLPAKFLVPPPAIDNVSGQYLANAGVHTFACSETQKFGHVTFFWNGNRSGFFDEDLETFVEIPSDNCPFNELPDMKAAEITAAGHEALRSGKFGMVRINYANPDMVGHTGDLEAVIRACTTVDKCVGELLATVDEMGGRWLIASDHGNSDDMVQRHKKTGEALMSDDGSTPLPLTSHTLAPVPVAIGGKGLPDSVVFRDDLPDAGLANITGTFVELLGFKAPDCWEPSLLTTKA